MADVVSVLVEGVAVEVESPTRTISVEVGVQGPGLQFVVLEAGAPVPDPPLPFTLYLRKV